MHGLLQASYDAYKIKNDNPDRVEGYHGVKQEASRAAYRAADVLFTILALVLLYDCLVVMGWSIWLLVLILLLLSIPFLGGIMALFVILFWVIAVRPRSHLIS